MENSLQGILLFCSAISAILGLVITISMITGKVLFVKTKSQVVIEQHEKRIASLEEHCKENKRSHAMIFKCNMAIINGLKKGKINGDIDDIKDEMDKMIFEQLGSSGH